MATDSLAAFRAASKFAEHAAGFLANLYSLTSIGAPSEAAPEIAKFQSEWDQHVKVLEDYEDRITLVSNRVTYADQQYPNAHDAATQIPWRILKAIEQVLVDKGAINERVAKGLPQLDPAVIESNWSVVRNVVHCFVNELRRCDPTFELAHDASWLRTEVARERSRLIQDLEMSDDRIRSLSVKNGAKSTATVNQRMLEEIHRNLNECLGWTRYEWAQRLDCSESTVQGTDAWRQIQTSRQAEQLDTATRKRPTKNR